MAAKTKTKSSPDSTSTPSEVNPTAVKPRTILITYRLPEEIEPNPRNNRFGTYQEEDFLDILADLDSGTGIRYPLLTRKLAGTDNAVECVAGSRRQAAVRHWNANHPPSQAYRLPIIIDTLSDDEAMEENIRENVKHLTLRPMDRAIGIRNMRQRGKSDTEICKMYGCSPATLKQSVKLLQLDRGTQARIGKDIPGDAALVLAEMDAESRNNVIAQHKLDGTKFTKSSVLKTGRMCGGVGDGRVDEVGRKPKRHSRTLKEITDYIEDFIFSPTLSEAGQRMMQGWKGMIEGKLTDDEMNKLLWELFPAPSKKA